MISAPVPNWSHLALFRWILTFVGVVWLSTVMSTHAKDIAKLNDVGDSSRSSPSLKKPKHAMQANAQRSTVLFVSEMIGLRSS